MRNEIVITDVRFAAAPEALRRTGLHGWASCVMNGLLRLQGIAVRRTRVGDITISFPRRKDDFATEHRYFVPTSAAIGFEIERQVLEALGLRQVVEE